MWFATKDAENVEETFESEAELDGIDFVVAVVVVVVVVFVGGVVVPW